MFSIAVGGIYSIRGLIELSCRFIIADKLKLHKAGGCRETLNYERVFDEPLEFLQRDTGPKLDREDDPCPPY